MQTFSKTEHLTGTKAFETLISKGSSFFIFPYRVVFQLNADNSNVPARLGISVSKRKFSSAVERNRIKRLIREAYRKNKEAFFYPYLHKKSLTCNLLLIYVHHEILDYLSIEQKTREVLKKLKHDYL